MSIVCLPTFWWNRVFSLSWVEQSNNALSLLEDRSPRPLDPRSAVAALFATLNDIVEVYAVLYRHIFSRSCKHHDICALEITYGKRV